MSNLPANPVFCALDTTDSARAATLAHSLQGVAGGLKLGLEFFYACGHAGYRSVAEAGLPLFLDLKLHDIPNTVAGGVRALLPLRPTIMTIHAGGGLAMMKAAVEAAAEAGDDRPLIVGVTVLTSLDQSDLAAMGVQGSTGEQVLRLAELAEKAGLDGVVCSAHEIGALRRERSPGFKLIVPGIRPAGAAIGDQKRVMSPADALALGADVLVIGRPITEAADPRAAAEAIRTSLS
ncbi:MAG: orotidine-5'-phosphate decarboxylase [Parvibaculaceae bacterium]|nr:orotidine-5'-phosphate decarboxylase [Parvibaculaceae bacterium]